MNANSSAEEYRTRAKPKLPFLLKGLICLSIVAVALFAQGISLIRLDAYYYSNSLERESFAGPGSFSRRLPNNTGTTIANSIDRSLLQTYDEMMEGPRPTPPKTPGAFIHIGKNGGSTMAAMLMNGCHSWVKKPCPGKQIQNESRISFLTTYYHSPDFEKDTIRKIPYQFYVVQIREPLSRFKSLFGAYHVGNAAARGKKDQLVSGTQVMKDRQKLFSTCFPSLEDFSSAIGLDKASWSPTYLKGDMALIQSCTKVMDAMLSYSSKYSEHWSWNHHTVYRRLLQGNEHFKHAVVLALRTEHLWVDWKTASQKLGDGNAEVPVNPDRKRAYSLLDLPVSTELSEDGREKLCGALKDEYKAYIALLRSAVNLNATDREESLALVKRNCPSLHLSLAF